MKITKRFKWVMGHRLAFHKGECYTPHGHNYEMKITVEGEPNQNGIVIDFNELSNLFKELIHEPYDHSFLLYINDSDLIIINKNTRPFKLRYVSFETTAENLAKFIFENFSKKINNDKIKVTRVKVYETPTSEAVYYGND